MKAVVFLTFRDIMKCFGFTLWVSFGSMGQKLPLCLLPEQHFCNTLRCLGFIFFYDVCIEIFCCACTCVAQLRRHRYNICSVAQKNGSNGVSERVGIDMGQAMAGGEVIEPAGDTVGAHVVAVVLGEDVAGMLPAIAVCKLEPELFPPVLPK